MGHSARHDHEPVLRRGFGQTIWATLIGVALGIPIGLFLDYIRRRTASLEETKQKEEEEAHALQVARAAVTDNVAALVDLQQTLRSNKQFPLTGGTTTGSWEAVRAAAFGALRKDPLLRADLSSFFDRLWRVEDLNRVCVITARRRV
jgi:hypothetical protein